MDFNLNDIMKSAGVPSKPTPKASFPVKVVPITNAKGQTPSEERAEIEREIVQQPNEPAVNGAPSIPVEAAIEICACGHPQDAHDEEGICEILECECQSWCPPSHSYDINQASPLLPGTESVVTGEVAAPLAPPPEVPPVAVPPVAEVVQEGEALPEPAVDSNIPDDYCSHLCDNPDCLKWWTHGPKADCKYPDVLKQGLCQCCNTNGETFQIEPENDIKDGKLLPMAQIKVRNDERLVCKNMNVSQLTLHIQFLAVRVEELRVRGLEARKMRSELEEEELANIPEHEREAFIQALRRGDANGKKERKPRKAKDPSVMTPKAKETALINQLKTQGKPTEVAKVIASMMLKTGKTQEQVEAWLND